MLSNAGEHIEVLKNHIQDQAQFANLCRNIIADLGLPIDLDDPMDGETNPEDIETVDQSDESDSEFSPEDVALVEESQGDETEDGETETVEMDAHADMEEAAGEADPDESACLCQTTQADHGRS